MIFMSSIINAEKAHGQLKCRQWSNEHRDVCSSIYAIEVTYKTAQYTRHHRRTLRRCFPLSDDLRIPARFDRIRLINLPPHLGRKVTLVDLDLIDHAHPDKMLGQISTALLAAGKQRIVRKCKKEKSKN